MASGGGKRRDDDTAPVDHGTRTGLVIDQLLSRGPVIGRQAAAGSARGADDPWAPVSSVLRSTAPSILEGHLTWLVNVTVPDELLSPQRVLTEDQARILIRALDEGGEDDAIARALEQSWTLETVHDDHDVMAYASALGAVTGNQPDDSPYVALAHSAAAFAAGILDHRRSPVRRRRSA
ncbi:MAG TPA: hypothetical protein VN816_07945 [Acidimicrobiales bacterium]|nr:hypothetical protein [Acidimicrobiales bacterium]